jgi:hypothetical protein
MAEARKKNKGRKIKLVTADRIFAAMMRRVDEINSCREYGVQIMAVVLFGSTSVENRTLGTSTSMYHFARSRISMLDVKLSNTGPPER